MTDVAHPVSLVSVPDPRDRANTGGEPAGRIVLPYLLFGLAFLAAIVVFVGQSDDPDAAAWVAASLFFLAVSGVLLLALVRKEFRRRRVVETSVAELDNALTTLGRLGAGLAEVAHHEIFETVLERVARALEADRVTVHLDGQREAVSWGPSVNGTRDAVTFPLQVQGRVIGALEVAIHDRRRLGGRETQLVRIVAGRLASVVEERRLFLAERRAFDEAQLARDELGLAVTEAEQRATQLRRLTEASIALAAAPNPAQVAAVAADQARQVLDGCAAEVIVVCAGEAPMRETSVDGEHVDRADPFHHARIMAAPLTGRCTGMIRVAAKHADSFSAHDESILTSLAQTVSVSLANADLYEEARRSEARRAAAVDESPLGILEIDAAGAVVRANRSAQAILGWPSTTPPQPPFDAATQVTITELCQRAMAGDTVIGVEVPAHRVDGTPIDVSISAAPVCGSDGPPQLVVVVLADMTERHQLERQLSQAARLESLGRLAGGVAHDFNNLLTVILGYTELVLARTGDDDAAKADLEAVCRAGEQAKALTNQLLTLSRRRVTAPVVLDPNEIVNSIGGVLRRLVGSSVDIHVHADVDAGWVEIDRGQLEQVLLNLAVNGRDAMPDGGELRIATRRGTMSVTGAPAVVLEVGDAGMGMDAPTADRCFDPFFTTKERQGGTGLGLSMVYGAVTQAGGHISVQSEPGRGSTFVIELPRVSAPGEITDRTSTVEAGPGGRILLVEDEEPVRRLARHMLEEHGYDVVEAASGAEALLAARIGKPPELLLTDVVMPGMSGAELARRWYELLPETPILFISGYADEDALRLADGMRLLQKPFRAQELIAAVRETLAPRAPVGSSQGSNR